MIISRVPAMRPGSPDMWVPGKEVDTGESPFSDLLGCRRIVFPDVRPEMSELLDRTGRPDDPHERGGFSSRFFPQERSHLVTLA